MSWEHRISEAFEHALVLPLNPDSKYILLSDCHRGIGNGNDNFLKNEPIYMAALKYYLREGFTLIELGDGDELWENRSINRIKRAHLPCFELLSEYYSQGRMYALYGNHDIIKRSSHCSEKHYCSYFSDQDMCSRPLFPGITFHSGIILKNTAGEKNLFLTHGHQADLLNSTFWPAARFLVRYIWRPLERLGIPDPTSAAKNNHRKKTSEKRLTKWAVTHQHILIAGHTHHPMTGSETSPYFNTGSCISPGSITGIEIEHDYIRLVKWSLDTRDDLSLYAARNVLGDVTNMK